jgi:hypothetical protein
MNCKTHDLAKLEKLVFGYLKNEKKESSNAGKIV